MIVLLIILFIVLFILTTREDLNKKRLEVDEQGNVYISSVPVVSMLESALRKAAENQVRISDLDEETLKYNKVYKLNLTGDETDKNYFLVAPNGSNYKTFS